MLVAVMMKITIKDVTMMVGTAVDQMSIQISVMNVCALNEKLADQNTISRFSMLKVVSLCIFCTNKLQRRWEFDSGDCCGSFVNTYYRTITKFDRIQFLNFLFKKL